MTSNTVPLFYLYGEPHRAAAHGFVHVEDLDDRSRPSEWTIRPHAHADLHHIFFVETGGGSILLEAETIAFTAPALLIVPAATVHGFLWSHESKGTVLTLAQNHLQELARCDSSISTLFAVGRLIDLADEAAMTARNNMATLVRELGWSAIGHHAAVEASLLAIAVVAMRGLGAEADLGPSPRGQQSALVARFRERIDLHFRRRTPVAEHAAALGVSESNLRAACSRIAARSPARMIDDRAMLEAQRALLYSNMTIGQVAYSIGFDDPAYFSRFFTRKAGISPRSYRRERQIAS